MIFSDVIEIETAVVLLVTLGRISTSTQELHCKKIENLLLDTLTKSKPITIGVLYRLSKPSWIHGFNDRKNF